MAKKSITITVTDPDFTLPKHLQKPLDVAIAIDGLSAVDCAALLNNVMTQILKTVAEELQTLNTNPLKKIN